MLGCEDDTRSSNTRTLKAPIPHAGVHGGVLTQAIRDPSRQGPETLDRTSADTDSEQGSPVRLPMSASRGHH